MTATTTSDAAAHVLERLDPEQRAVAEAVTGPVCVLAGAGTGKTRAITHRIAYGALVGALPPEHVLAVTFTTRAAGELRGRLRALGVPAVQARTFHSAALRQVQHFWPQVVGGRAPQVLAQKAQLVARAASRAGLGADRAMVRDLSGEVEWAKSRLVAPAGYADAVAEHDREPPAEPERVAAVMEVYEQLKDADGVADFEDLLALDAALLEDSPAVAQKVRAQYRHLVVDEFQDVTPLQSRLLDAWRGGSDEVCVVGDPNQTIYSFAGASERPLLDFGRRFPGTTLVRLERDYRSTPQVVEVATAVLRGSPTARAAGVRLVAQRPPGPPVRLVEHDHEDDESAWVADEAARLRDAGVPLGEVAVLFRTQAQSAPLESALSAAGLPYQVRGGERFFRREEVRRAVTYLRGAARGVEAVESVARMPLGERVRSVLSETGWEEASPPPGGQARERWESLAALARLADALEASEPDADLVRFARELDERADDANPPDVEGVVLSTLHASKGLEFDAVLVVGCVEGLLPVGQADTPERVEEERRLLHVGVTRAREHLVLSWPLARSAGGRRRKPSRFLAPLRPAGAQALDQARTSSRRKGSALDDLPDDVDAGLVERLRAWRSETASAAGKPAFVVFADQTLLELARRRPTTPAELLRVHGFGAKKVDAYGEGLLTLLRDG